MVTGDNILTAKKIAEEWYVAAAIYVEPCPLAKLSCLTLGQRHLLRRGHRHGG
jgi:magnesium-transporting ATPase (P-type)